MDLRGHQPAVPDQTQTLLHTQTNPAMYASKTLLQSEEVPFILQRKNPSILNSLSTSSRELHHQPSKLDLIDGTTLTSLPFPPPPPKHRHRRRDLSCSKLSKSSVSTFSELLVPGASGDSLSNSLSIRTDDVATIQEFSEDNCDTFIGTDETFEESQDPIVLVEDYVRDISVKSENEHGLTRKASLATFKKRYMGMTCRSASLPVVESPFRAGSKRSISNEDSYFGRTQTEDLEAIFGKIPGSDKLKYCDLCDRPLYEISSIISNTEEHSGMLSKRDNITQLYNEFICWECINVYEHFLDELYEAEVEKARRVQLETKKDNFTTDRLLGMFRSIRETYRTEIMDLQPPRKQSKRAFSPDLINRLHYLSSMSKPKCIETDWLTNLRNKLRWRWRLYSLLPGPFTFDKQTNE